jgi:hypothetical protein
MLLEKIRLGRSRGPDQYVGVPNRSPFRSFQKSIEIVRLTVMPHVRFPLSLRTVEDLLHERAIEVSHETVRFWWRRFGPKFVAEIRKHHIEGLQSSLWRGTSMGCLRRSRRDALHLAGGLVRGNQFDRLIADRMWISAALWKPYPLKGNSFGSCH